METSRCALGFGIWLLMLGCGGGDAPSESQNEIDALVTDFQGAFDRLALDNCPCFVEMGAYASIDECLRMHQPREDWTPCVRSILSKHQTPEVLDAFRCMSDATEATRACLATKACDPVERAECGHSPLECLGGLPELGLEIVQQCPEVSPFSQSGV